jgi:dynamin 1-like protein
MVQPSSVEPVNGNAIPDEEDDSGDEARSINGVMSGKGSDSRSITSVTHDRTRSTPAGPSSTVGSIRRPSSPKAPHHQHHRHSAQPPNSNQAKESFLNYFFGQNGPGPLAGASVERAMTTQGATTITPVGRDVSSGEPPVRSGLLAGKRSLEGGNAGSSAAFDMKSLGKHIEAVGIYSWCAITETDSVLARRQRVARN